MLGLLWFLQRRVAKTQSRKRDAEPITVLGRQGLGAKAQLVVVQTEDARYVLGVTEHGVSVVDRLPLRPEPAAPPTGPAPRDAAADAAEFERILAAAALTGTPATSGTPATPALPAAPGDGTPGDRTPGDGTELRRRVRHRNDPLRGSILSPDTWRQTAEALRRAR
ncbi:flagellar biosynthetic protein FliO [Microbacterium sufflavum]|uniref:flagellar biosynthetic protein FliO n=1 Tax=Microbacterium sufflavum TaxID=2851649 RepID=UPI001FFD97F0|nr:flagellar biosynthetic protein FliO [Microbacterium sufflavum]